MTDYAVEQLDHVALASGSPLDGMDLMAPFVWKEGGQYRIMVRGVPPISSSPGPTGVIASRMSKDGLTFTIDPELSISPRRMDGGA